MSVSISFGSPSEVAAVQSEGNIFTGANPNIYRDVDQVSNKISTIGGLDSSSAFRFFTDLRDYNNDWSAEQARIQRDWQEKQNAKAMQFNADEAAKNRDWQEMMSNTAHQREIRDLQAAGLNPILSAMNGNGAAVTSGATASGVTSSGAAGQTDTSLNSVIVNLLGSFLDSQTKLQQANINAINNLAVADKQGEISKTLAELNSALRKDEAEQGYWHSKWLAENKYDLDVAFRSLFPENMWSSAALSGRMIGDLFFGNNTSTRNPSGVKADYQSLGDSILTLLGFGPHVKAKKFIERANER